jgi:hypothetical protein
MTSRAIATSSAFGALNWDIKKDRSSYAVSSKPESIGEVSLRQDGCDGLTNDSMHLVESQQLAVQNRLTTTSELCR